MHLKSTAAAITLLLAFGPQAGIARDVPRGLKAFYDTVKNGGTCSGSDLLQGGFYDEDDGSKNYGYCRKGMKDKGFYLKGPSSKLANMDIDCDGHQTKGDGRCGGSSDTQSQTRWQDEVKEYGGISDLNAYIHP
jgi:chitosanase